MSQRPGMSPSTQDSLDWVGLYPTGRRDVLEPHSGVALSRCFPLSVNQRALVTRRSGSQITIGAGLQSPRSQAGIWPDGGSGEGERPGYGAAGVRHRTGATAPAGRDGAEGLNQWRGGGHRPREPHNCSLIWPATAAPLRTSRTPTTATRRSASGARFDGIYVSCLRCKEAGGILLVVAQGGRPAAGGLRYRSGGTRGGQAALPVLRTAYCGGELADYPRRNGQHRVQRLLEVRRRLSVTHAPYRSSSARPRRPRASSLPALAALSMIHPLNVFIPARCRSSRCRPPARAGNRSVGRAAFWPVWQPR